MQTKTKRRGRCAGSEALPVLHVQQEAVRTAKEAVLLLQARSS
jgi:hypothetical protein